jgi:hypothetical protein
MNPRLNAYRRGARSVIHHHSPRYSLQAHEFSLQVRLAPRGGEPKVREQRLPHLVVGRLSHKDAWRA